MGELRTYRIDYTVTGIAAIEALKIDSIDGEDE